MPLLPVLIVSLVALATAPPATLQRFEAVEPHMGTLVRVTVYTQGEAEAGAAFQAAFDRIRELDRVLSDYRPDSELNNLTRTAIRRPVQVSADLFAVLLASQALAEETGGAFDITQGPVIRLWRDARKAGRVPEVDAVKDAASRSGFRKLRLNVQDRTATLDMPGMALDVGAIGKGYAASAAVAVLSARGVRSALVAISGDLAFSEPPPGRRGWKIRVHSEDASTVSIPSVLELSNAAVSTSGNAQQHLDAGGRRYSHVIDPSTGLGLQEDVTVTVVARHGMDADGLDTAISILGPERGLALVDSRAEAAALMITRTAAGTSVRSSSRFAALVKPQ